MRILFIGDVVGKPGRDVVRSALGELRRAVSPDFVIANGENCAHGAGLTASSVKELFRAGCDVLTGGNHTLLRREINSKLETEPRLLRPANYAVGTPGTGLGIYRAADGSEIAVLNLQGRVFMGEIEDPFQTADRILSGIGGRVKTVVVDIHAEATSEKIAMGWHLDGKVTAVVGTHTHVATADERILPGGTAYITDVGMTGPHDSVLGVEKEIILERFLTGRAVRFVVAEGDVRMSAVLIEADPETGSATSIRRMVWPDSQSPGEAK
jgi:metallophosphoesterase (TIGR00282 family)